jgi:ferric iron reductase protein FhuF
VTETTSVTTTATPTDRNGLGRAIKAAVARLGAYGNDYPIHFEVPAGAEAVPALELFQPQNLHTYSVSSVGRWADNAAEDDPRALLAQLWREYSYCLIGPLIAPLAHGVALDFALPRVSIVMKAGTPVGLLVDLDRMPTRACAERPTTWPLARSSIATLAELRRIVFANIFVENVQPAIERVLQYVKVSRRLLWCQIAEAVDGGYDHAVDFNSAQDYEPLAADREVLLFSTELPGVPGPNPLSGYLTWEPIPGFKRPQRVRKICCFAYLLKRPQERYCRTCGIISRDERLMIWGRFAARPSAQIYLRKPRPLELERD